MKTTPIKRAPRGARTPKPRIGFWSYDLYPFVYPQVILGQSPHGDGIEYHVEGGYVNWTKPLAIMSQTEGRELFAHLDSLKAHYRRERANLDGEFNNLAQILLPFKVPALAAKD